MTVLINGIEYAALTDFAINEKIGNKTASTVSVEVGDGQPFPCAGDIIEIKDGDTSVFWGVCGIPSSPKYTNLNEKRIYKITCGNANSLLAYRIANVAYQNYSVTQIVQALFDMYIAEEGITLGHISDIPVSLEVYTAKDFVLQNAIGELANLVGATWTITADKRFYFLAVEDFPRFAQTISSQSLLGADMQHTSMDYKTRTVQYVSGAVDRTSTQSETHSYDGEQKSFTLSFALAQKPEIAVNGITVPPELIGIKGIDDTEGVVFSFGYDGELVSYDTSSNLLVEGDVLTFTYVGLFPIRVSSMNHSKIAEIAALTGTSGKRETITSDKTIVSQADAIKLAESLLSRFSEGTSKITFWVLSDELYRLGYTINDLAICTQMSFDLPEINIVGDYVITERQLTLHNAAPYTSFERRLKISFTLQNRDYLKSYGEMLSDLRRDINQLAIREEDVVVYLNSFSESVRLGENITISANFAYCAVNAGCTQLFSPVPLSEYTYPI